MVPARGTEKAKFRRVPPAPVRSIFPPRRLTPLAELPNPKRLVVPTTPPSIEVSVEGMPDANGMIAPDPATPVAPVAPVGPAGPMSPVAPVGPAGPMSLVAPGGAAGTM